RGSCPAAPAAPAPAAPGSRGPASAPQAAATAASALPSRTLAFHGSNLGDADAKSGDRAQLLAEGRGIAGVALGHADLDLATLGRTLAEAHGIWAFGQLEGDEEARVVHAEGEPLCLGQHGGFKGEHEIQRQDAVLVLEPIVARLAELDGLASQLRVS